MTYSREERETTCVWDALTNTWTIYTCEPKHRRKLVRLYGAPTTSEGDDDGDGATWRGLPGRVVGWRSTQKRVVDAAKAAARLAEARKARGAGRSGGSGG